MSRSDAYIPDRGDFARMVLHPHTGREQGGERPVIVLSGRRFNTLTGYALVAPITRTVREWPFEIPVEAGSQVTGVVLCDQTRSVDFAARNARFLGKAPSHLTDRVAATVAAILEQTGE